MAEGNVEADGSAEWGEAAVQRETTPPAHAHHLMEGNGPATHMRAKEMALQRTCVAEP